jgi:hypothetical protein
MQYLCLLSYLYLLSYGPPHLQEAQQGIHQNASKLSPPCSKG